MMASSVSAAVAHPTIIRARSSITAARFNSSSRDSLALALARARARARPYRAAGVSLLARRSPSLSVVVRCFSALSPELSSTLDKVVRSHKVILFMKGSKDFPQCGFSNTVVQILKSLNVPFETLDILENDMLRQGLKDYSSWPTFPQLYIDGDFFGGCDITVEAFKSGELQEVLERAMCS